MKRDKKGSLTRELAVILVGLVAGTIMLCWFINTSFLEIIGNVFGKILYVE